MQTTTISEQLKCWKSRLTVVSRNLMDMAQAESTKRVRAGLKDTEQGFSGLTRKKATEVIKILDDLWDNYLLLARVVEEASKLADKNGIFRNTEEQVRELLEGASVELPARDVPVTGRDLLADVRKGERISPSEMLSNMEKAFAEARDTLSTIVDAMAHGKRLSAIRDEAAALEERAKALGAQSGFSGDLSQVISEAETDPLSYGNEVERLEAEVAGVRTELQGIEDERNSIRASLERGKGVFGELKDLVSRSNATIAEARVKISEPEGLVDPMSNEALDSLESWLNTLQENINAGRFSAVKVGIAKWELESNARLSEERVKYAGNRAALDEPADLRGRFKALCAKAKVLKERGVVEEGMLESLSNRTKEALDVRPLDIRLARQVLGAFETALRVRAG